MSRIAATFDALRAQDRAACIPFVTAGDPSPEVTVALLHALAEGGADIIELGIPFSDPMADGPVIQRADERALAHGVNLRQVLAWVREFRERDGHTPLVLMGYLNPIEAMGAEIFAEAAAAAGADGVILVDMPPEEGDDYAALLRAHGLDPIFLLAPTSGPERVEAVARLVGGFIYYVSLRGITGAAHLDLAPVLTRVGELRERLQLPIGVGFGIKDPETAAAVARGADAVVVGSALVQRLEGCQGLDEVLARAREFVGSLARAIHGAREGRA